MEKELQSMNVKKILIWLPAIVMAMVIFGFSKQDGEESSGLSYKAADVILTVCVRLELLIIMRITGKV